MTRLGWGHRPEVLASCILDGKLIAPLSNLAVFIQDAVHGPNGAIVEALVKQGSIDFGRGQISETWLPHQVKHGLSFDRGQCSVWAGPGPGFGRRLSTAASAGQPPHTHTDNAATTRRHASLVGLLLANWRRRFGSDQKRLTAALRNWRKRPTLWAQIDISTESAARRL